MHSYSVSRGVALSAALLALISTLGSTATSAESLTETLTPSTVFVQAGVGDQDTTAYLTGASWDLPWQRRLGPTTVGGYFEAAFGRWTTRQHGERSTAWPTQIDLTPVLRVRPDGTLHPWFAEVGVGANYIVPVFDSGRKRFSTEFNFGDHVALGRAFGSQERHEVSVRVEHFSNAGIEHPNPGENFVQLRYAYRLK
jgi:hypothetical protein